MAQANNVETTSASSTSRILKWTKSNPGYLKFNVNATIFKEQNLYEVGLCIHNNNCDFVLAKSILKQGLSSNF